MDTAELQLEGYDIVAINILEEKTNYPKINWNTLISQDARGNKLIETVRDNFWQQLLTEPTNTRENEQPSTLYLVFTNDEL